MITTEILKAQLGTIQANINIRTIEPFIKASERWFRKQIGSSFWQYLTELEPEPDSDEADLLYLAHACLSWHCYEAAFPHLKLRVGDLGVQKSNTQNAVSVSKWEYVDSREANLAMLDVSLENFWSAVDEIQPDAWLESDAYARRQTCLIRSAQEMAEHVPSMGRKSRLFELLLPYIRRAEQFYIRPVLTDELYTALKLKWVTPGAVLTNDEKRLVEQIRPALAHLALAEAYPYLPLQLDENGIRERRSKDGILEDVTPTEGTKSAQKRQLYQDGQTYLAELGQYLDSVASPTLFPTYYQRRLASQASAEPEDFSNQSLIIL